MVSIDGADSRKPFVLDSCPLCEYDLRGLPSPHTCPECGFEYDEATIVLPCWVTKQGRESWQRRTFQMVVITTLGLSVLCLAGSLVTRTNPAIGFVLVVLLFIIIAIGSGYVSKRLFPRAAKSEVVLTISPSGIGCRTRIRSMSAISPWDEFKSVGIRSAGGGLHRLKLRRRRTGKLPKIPLSVLFEADKAEPGMLKHQIERYLAAGGPPESATGAPE